MPDPLTPEQIELLRSLPRHDEEQRLLTEDEFRELRKLPRFEGGWISKGYRHSEGFVRGDIEKFDHTHGMNYRNRSWLADVFLATLDAETAALKARIAELEGVLGGLVRAVDNAREREPAVTKDPGYIFHEIPQPLAAAKATLAATTSEEQNNGR